MISEQVFFSPKVSCRSVIVIVDVGDDVGEPNDAGFVWEFIGSSGHTEGRMLLDSNNPAATETTQSDAQSRINPLVGPLVKRELWAATGPLLSPNLV